MGVCVCQGRGRGRQLPERVRRSLNPTLFRNIEYDVWHKTKRGDTKETHRMVVIKICAADQSVDDV